MRRLFALVLLGSWAMLGCATAGSQVQPTFLDRVDAAEAREAATSTYGPRAELAATQTLYTLPIFAAIGVVAGEGGQSEVSAVFGSALLGGATVGGLTYAFSDGMTFGQVQAFESVVPWAAWHGAALVLAKDDKVATAGAVIGVGGYLLSPLIGAGLATLKPHSGTVALANSAGLWTTVGILLAREGFLPAPTSNFATRPHFDNFTVIGLLLAGDLAIVGGALLGRELRPSRGDVFALDGLALLGLGLGALAGSQLHRADVEAGTAAAQCAVIGLVAGLGVGAWLLPRWTVPLPPNIHPSLAPGVDGTWQLGLHGRF
jgi:hypothetical protein